LLLELLLWRSWPLDPERLLLENNRKGAMIRCDYALNAIFSLKVGKQFTVKHSSAQPKKKKKKTTKKKREKRQKYKTM
jgi:hypothetical protein